MLPAKAKSKIELLTNSQYLTGVKNATESFSNDPEVVNWLQKFETEVRKDKDLKDLHTLTNEATGGLLFNVPTGVKIGEDINVLMMAVEP